MGRYTTAHQKGNLAGPGDARPTALQIIEHNDRLNTMANKVFLVTGVSSGIGPETARAFAATGGKVYMTVRNLSKGKEACKDFLEPGRVELLEMDNNSLESVRRAAKEFLEKSEGRLNVLVNNAGIMAAPFERTKDGFESQFGVNHLAHFLLFKLVEEAMLKSSQPDFQSRVVNVSSIGHAAGEVQFGNYDFKNGEEYTPWKGYGQSKTANIYMANEIEKRFGQQEKGIHGYSLHPGGIWTGLQKFVGEETMKQWKARPGVENMLKSEAQGAATSVLAAVGKEFEGKGGVYLVDCEAAKPQSEDPEEGYAPWAYDAEKATKLWEDSLRMIGLE